jgi:hypothetical protein
MPKSEEDRAYRKDALASLLRDAAKCFEYPEIARKRIDRILHGLTDGEEQLAALLPDVADPDVHRMLREVRQNLGTGLLVLIIMAAELKPGAD